VKQAPRVYCGGTWDLLHPGHVEILRQAASLGDVSAVVNSDDYAFSLKGKLPVMNYKERAYMLLTNIYVHDVYYNDGDEEWIIRQVNPKYIVYALGPGGEYDRESYLSVLGIDEAYLAVNDIELVFLEYTEGVSSTDIVQRILQRNDCESCESCGSSQDAGQSDVSDAPTGRDDCSCLRLVASGPGEGQGTLPEYLLPCA
jgi:cytidyltransferase-like protein